MIEARPGLTKQEKKRAARRASWLFICLGWPREIGPDERRRISAARQSANRAKRRRNRKLNQMNGYQRALLRRRQLRAGGAR